MDKIRNKLLAAYRERLLSNKGVFTVLAGRNSE